MARLRQPARPRGGRYRELGVGAGVELRYYAAWPDMPLPSRGQAALARHEAYLAGKPYEVLPVEVLELLPESQHPPVGERVLLGVGHTFEEQLAWQARHEAGEALPSYATVHPVHVDDGRRFRLGPGDSLRPFTPKRADPTRDAPSPAPPSSPASGRV